jgi:HAD superfamily hydrolase (TIGR01450 family)
VTILLDLDGVVWLGDEAIPGSAEAIGRLRDAGERVMFFTNNSAPRIADHLAKLARMGIECGAEDFLTSAQAAAELVEPGARALVIGGPGIGEALLARGVTPITPGGPGVIGGGVVDAVVVGFDRSFDFERLAAATTAVLAGARLIATNQDPTYPSPSGPLPGAGSFAAAVAYASGTSPVAAGKPEEPAARLLAARASGIDVAIGDRPSTDGAFARRLGARFGLVLTGVTLHGHGALDPSPDLEADDLLALVNLLTKP